MPERNTVIPFSTGAAGATPKPRAEPREAPHNHEAEQGLLGALLVENRAFERVSEFLRPDHFYAAIHGRIYDAIAKRLNAGNAATPVTLKLAFEEDPALAQLGGASYFADLIANVVTITNIEDYARQIVDLHLRRKLIELGDAMIVKAHNHELDNAAENQIEAAEQGLFNLATDNNSGRDFRTFSRVPDRGDQARGNRL